MLSDFDIGVGLVLLMALSFFAGLFVGSLIASGDAILLDDDDRNDNTHPIP